MLENLFSFINNKWDEMPSSVKVFSYLSILMSFIYLLLTPHFIDGKLVGIVPETGQEFAIQHEVFELDIDGRTIRFVTNGRGRFAIPKPSKLPVSNVSLTFFPEGTENGSPEDEVKISIFDSLVGTTKIIENNGNFSVHSDKGMREGLVGLLFNSVYAQPPRSSHVSRSVKESVYAAFSKEVSSGAPVNSGSRIADLQISNRQFSSILSQIENEQKIVINTDRNKIRTVGDLLAVANKQKEPQSWSSAVSSEIVPPRRLFGREVVLPIKNSNLSIEPEKLLSDSARIKVVSGTDGTRRAVFTGQIYIGERVNIDSEGHRYSIQLEKIDQATFEPNAAHFKVVMK